MMTDRCHVSSPCTQFMGDEDMFDWEGDDEDAGDAEEEESEESKERDEL